MKTLAWLLVCVWTIERGYAAIGDINVYNGSTSLISNAHTELRVQPADGIHIQFYYAPGNTTDESIFMSAFPPTKVGPNAIAAGRYNANPPGGGPSFLPGQNQGDLISVQMRAYETNYGTTYEAAENAPPMNGRRALIGKSAIAQIVFPGPTGIAPTTEVCGGFFVDIARGAPYLFANDVVVAEGSNGTATANFRISLLNTQAETISVDFATADGTALADSDYLSTNGTVTFAPGENEKFVSVTLVPDLPVEPDEMFYLDLSNAVNGIVRRSRGNCTITEIRIVSTSVDAAVSFNTVSTRHYMVQRSTNFISWEPVAGATNVPGTGAIMTIVDRGNGRLSPVIYRATVVEQ